MEYVRKELYDDIVSNSNMVTGDEYRELVCAVAQAASDMVTKTLGPYGATTVIDDGTGFTYPSKDGWTCLSKLMFTDPTYNSIFQMLKKISFNSVTTVGDGTTSAMVTANNFLRTMYMDFIPKMKEKGSNFRQATFVESMQKVYNTLETALKRNPHIHQIDLDGDFEDIYRIAYIATNGNEAFSRLIQSVYQQTKNPNIQVVLDGNSSKTSIEIQRGYKFDAHVLNYNAYCNDDAGTITYKDAPHKIIVFDHNVTFQSHEKIISAIIQMTKRDNCSVIIMAPYFDDIVTSWMGSQVQRLIQARMVPSIMMVQVPITMEVHRKTLSDLTVLTNTQVFTDGLVRAFNILLHNQTHESSEQMEIDQALKMLIEDHDLNSPEMVIRSCMGTAQSIIFNIHGEAFIQDYEHTSNEQMYKNLLKDVTEDYQAKRAKALKTIGGTLDKEFLFTQLRYIKLTGSMGVIKVGALSDIQQHTDKDTIDDAVLACRSAFENGYVRGMNLEILTLLNQMLTEELPLGEPYEYYHDILRMLYNCFYLTSYQVIENKHPDDDTRRRIIVGDRVYDDNNPTEVIKDPIVFTLSSSEVLDLCIKDPVGYDYNLREEAMHTADYWNVINSTATDIEILRAVVNVLSTVVTSNQFLSVTRRYDRRVTDEKTLARHLEEDARIQANKVKATMETLAKDSNWTQLKTNLGISQLILPMIQEMEGTPGEGIQELGQPDVRMVQYGHEMTPMTGVGTTLTTSRDPENGQPT